MKILVLAPQWPDPPTQGAAIRNLHILLYLAQRHDVYLLTFASDPSMEMGRLRQVCKHAEAVPPPHRSPVSRINRLATSLLPDMAWRLHSDAMQERVRRLSAQVSFDAVHIEGIEMAPYALQIHASQPHAPIRFTYDAHNAEYLLQRRAFKLDSRDARRMPKALYSFVQSQRLRAFECDVCLLSSSVLAVSKRDRAALGRLAPEKLNSIEVLPNGVDTAYWSRDAAYPPAELPLGGDVLVFDGTMDFRPNVDAVLWFASHIWPRVQAGRPNARFYIVGRNPAPDVIALANRPGIVVTGGVPDTRGWVAGASVYVVPMRMGGGVRLKVLQAMAMGCAVVSTPMGADGISVRPGTDLLLARRPDDFAATTLALLEDTDLRARLGRAARERVSNLYAWDNLLPVLDAVYPPGPQQWTAAATTQAPQAPQVAQPASPQRPVTAPLPPLLPALVEEASTGQAVDLQEGSSLASLPLSSQQGSTIQTGPLPPLEDLYATPPLAETRHTSVEDAQEAQDTSRDAVPGPGSPEDVAVEVAGQEPEEPLESYALADADTPVQVEASDGQERASPAVHTLESEAADFELFRATSRQSAKFDYFVETWLAFVVSIERGYGSTVFEYSKGLEKRDRLQAIMLELPDSIADMLMPVLQPWDRRFQAATQEVAHPVLGYANADRGLWWYRVPRLLKNKDYPEITFWRRDYPYTRVSSDTWRLDT